jgi:peptide/nickel transport system permease protein
MLRFVISRLLRSLVTLVLFQLILFGLIQAINQAIPIDMEALELAVSFQEDLGELVSETAVERESESMPLGEQFLGWMTAFYRGDLGESNSLGNTPVVEILKTKLPKSLLLLIPGTIGGFLLGFWLGKSIAWRPRGWTEFAATLGGTAFYTSFPPWLAFVMINVFGLSLNWFPPEKIIDPNKWAFQENVSLNGMIAKILITMAAGFCVYLLVVWWSRDFAHRKSVRWRILGGGGIIILMIIPWVLSGRWPLALDILDHLVLPLGTLILLAFGETMLIMKTTMTEAVVSEHVTTARAKGLPGVRVRDRHAARVAILPVLTRFIVHLPLIIIGSFVVEYLFYWDGMGGELIRAANDNDLPVLMGVLSIVGIGILLVHTILDILIRWLDPRLRKVEEPSRLLRRMS